MSKDHSSATQVWLHWIIAVIIITQFLSGDPTSILMKELHDDQMAWVDQPFAANYHMFIGIMVLLLASARLAIRLTIGVTHILGALYQIYINKQDSFKRMLRFSSK